MLTRSTKLLYRVAYAIGHGCYCGIDYSECDVVTYAVVRLQSDVNRGSVPEGASVRCGTVSRR